jgi:simple sugar transport system substrate-binding protein
VGSKMSKIERVTWSTLAAVALALACYVPAEAAEPVVTVVVKEEGIPWFGAFRKGVEQAGKDFQLNATMIGTTQADPAQQVGLVEDLIAKKVDVIGLVPLDQKSVEPVLLRAQQAGIPVITTEAPDQPNKTWNVDLTSNKKFGEVQMEELGKVMGGTGDYVVYVGTLTSPSHNAWADAAIAYQKEHFPNMHLVADRFGYGDSTDGAIEATQNVLTAYPTLKGILTEGTNGAIGAGNVLRQKGLNGKIKLVGTVLPSQARSLIEDGTISEGFLWSPIDDGYAVTAVAKLVLDKAEFKDGMTIPHLGVASVDPKNKDILVDKILYITKDNVGELAKEGL